MRRKARRCSAPMSIHTLFELHFLQAVECLDEFVYDLHPVFAGPTSGFGCRGTEFESEDGIIEFPATGMRREAETMLAKLIEYFSDCILHYAAHHLLEIFAAHQNRFFHFLQKQCLIKFCAKIKRPECSGGLIKIEVLY